MSLISKVNEKINKGRFNIVANRVFETHPIVADANPEIIIVSQIYSSAVHMTLVAIKSFIRFFGAASVELIDDGSLTKEDIHKIETHLIGVKIIHINDINIGSCPSGACWERLCYIIDRSQTSYVIQVDTDTLTTGPIAEIYNMVHSNTSFAVGAPMWPDKIPLSYLKTFTDALKNSHVQVQGEGLLNNIQSIELNSYLRTCAAFTGFAKGKFTLGYLERFSNEMQNKLGKEKWNEWGSEQFSSNVMISSIEDSVVLPWPKYQNYKFPSYSGEYQGVVSFIHFIGSCRFLDRKYEKMTKKIISDL
jgi:hypothetical protein